MDSILLENNKLGLRILPYGAIIQDLYLKSAEGTHQNLVLGHSQPDNYLVNPYYLGACIGRYAGRISSGGFSIGDTKYPLPSANGVHLHGGPEGLHQKTWNIVKVEEGEKPSLRLSCLSPHMESGYPGNLEAWVSYTLDSSTLRIAYSATVDQICPVNLTQHTYFVLDDTQTVDHYELQLNAQAYLETDEAQLPTGNVLPVVDTGFDFRQQRPLKSTRLDTPYILDSNPAARVYSPISKIQMTVNTDQPAVVVFTPGHFPGICFETQHYPDAPNQPQFPNTLIHPGESYNHHTAFTFDLVP